MILLDLFFPRRCVSCGKFGKYICDYCRGKIDKFRHFFCPVCFHPSIDGITHARCLTDFSLNGLFIFSPYQGPVRSCLKYLKYHLVSDLAGEFVNILISEFPKFLLSFDYIIPVPLHVRREKLRGFNQSQVLAAELTSHIKVEVLTKVLFRTKEAQPQYQLSREMRLFNVKGVFISKNQKVVKGKKIILVDDVATTLATLKECAKELKLAGAKSVWGVVFAHGN